MAKVMETNVGESRYLKKSLEGSRDGYLPKVLTRSGSGREDVARIYPYIPSVKALCILTCLMSLQRF